MLAHAGPLQSLEEVGVNAAAASGNQRDVVFVANAEGGTVTVIDARTFEVLREIDVLPDGEDASLTEDDPVQALAGQRVVEAAGGENFAQDQDISPDGRTLYASRGHRGDVAAFDIESGELLWKVPVSGLRADHMTISDDGRRLFVSALTEDIVEVIDVERAAVVASFPTGEWPHDNHLSHDGERLYNGSIGNITTPPETRDNRPDLAGLLLNEPYRLTIVDAETLEEQRAFEFDAGIRPFVITRNERRMYLQQSFFHGIREFDLEEGRMLRSVRLPIDEGVSEEDYSFEAPHHGLALSPDEGTLCAAGRASDYAALVDTETFRATAIIEVGDAPSWAATGPTGRNCYLANTRDDTVSVISYVRGEEVVRIGTGDGPKHLQPATVPESAICARSGPPNTWQC